MKQKDSTIENLKMFGLGFATISGAIIAISTIGLVASYFNLALMPVYDDDSNYWRAFGHFLNGAAVAAVVFMFFFGVKAIIGVCVSLGRGITGKEGFW